MRTAFVLSLLIAVLAAVASIAGLAVPGIYRETAWVVPQNRGQDLVTFVALLVFIPCAFATQRGSPRGTLIWLGLLGYLAYTYTGAAFAYGFNILFLVYVALFGLTGAALIAGLSAIDVVELRNSFDDTVPRKMVVTFLLTMAAILCLLWFSQIIPFYVDGTLPEMVVRAKTPTVFVYVLDLGVVVPLALLSAWWLHRNKPWGFVIAGFVTVKATTMGLALISMTLFAWIAGLPIDPYLSAAWIVLAGSGAIISFLFFRRCRR
jgi:hypothetical protein